jgi:VWFA-related protein
MALPSVRSCALVVALLVLALLTPGFRLMPELSAQPALAGWDRTLLVTVIDDEGAPIKGLTADQFVVLEDGAMREITNVRVANEPLSVALLIDTTQPPFGETLNIRDLRDGASAFIKTIHAAQPDAQIQLMEFAGASTVRVKFTTDTEQLDRSARRLFQSQQGGGPLVEGLVDAARDLRNRASPRRAIVAIDRSSPDPSRTRPEDLNGAIQESRAMLWAISIRAAGRGTAGREEMLGMLTDVTGGTYQTARVLSPLEGMLTRIADALTHQYVITYAQPAGSAPNDVLAGTTGAGKVLMGRMVEK